MALRTDPVIAVFDAASLAYAGGAFPMPGTSTRRLNVHRLGDSDSLGYLQLQTPVGRLPQPFDAVMYFPQFDQATR